MLPSSAGSPRGLPKPPLSSEWTKTGDQGPRTSLRCGKTAGCHPCAHHASIPPPSARPAVLPRPGPRSLTKHRAPITSLALIKEQVEFDLWPWTPPTQAPMPGSNFSHGNC